MDLRSWREADKSEHVELFTEDSDVLVIYWLATARELASRQDAWEKGWSRFADAAESECMRRGLPIAELSKQKGLVLLS
ncbi:hypothetical protein Terro_3116 [Terriglobus roseus DSM 18391]|uniref:Uncharacterized protein n=1 Tax=Terriglobus roseus (strain DSM 18391 / NRRL B-41598 / KBS 63) TaxID=926566 RepID=I3ZJC8_TERRK|nr:hypothetical protein [Terriglobus roseus]AFL89346.1 hypothetical protein Terro_3116 [Terriglobus roseus DSM 18391]